MTTEQHVNANGHIEIAHQRVKSLIERLTRLDEALSRSRDDFASVRGPDDALSLIPVRISQVSSQILHVESVLKTAEQRMDEATKLIRTMM